MTLRASSGWCTIGGAKFSSVVSDRRTVQPTQNGEISFVGNIPSFLWANGTNRVDTRLSDAQRFTAATSDATGALLATLVFLRKKVVGQSRSSPRHFRGAGVSLPVRAPRVVAGGSPGRSRRQSSLARRESSPRPSAPERFRASSRRRAQFKAAGWETHRLLRGLLTREATGHCAARNAVVDDRSRRPAIEDDRLASHVRDARRGGFPASGAPRVDAQRGAQRGVRG